MNLVEYITEIGDAAAAKQWGINVRTVKSWRHRERTPRRAQAEVIVQNSPVTYEGIYGPELPCKAPKEDHRRTKSKVKRTTDRRRTTQKPAQPPGEK